MLLYQFRKGTNPRRVIIYMSEKGIDVPRYELDYENKEHRSEAYLSINPSGRAPTLVTDAGEAITDSAAIVEYLEELYPEHPMFGTEAASRARVRSLERLAADLVGRGQLWLWNRTDAFLGKEPAPSLEVADRISRYVDEILNVLEKEIGEHAFLAGDTPTVADCTAFPIFQTARERFDLPFGDKHPRLDSWYKRFRSRPSADY
ncbi:Glutathione S-transferase domain [Methylorubrum populi BJ001]|jgi:glutathione S-transferase|uniref:Glutathione S-transferase domain n=1 Tax=Methylorubrum populi (strain ATCC BAA-705 / NCIMB 13946 / BJ001) TaxID=441620 RepID=B1Z9I8_METPB|nr:MULTISPECIES: glutathione S-transferase family protein [Methylorubrum]ACB81952.1 Glutathione S-transferase domain [Methylorubrum populi BJ001]MBB5765946.1 glutathione S-transferase [Methylorubrum rhodesianum]